MGIYASYQCHSSSSSLLDSEFSRTITLLYSFWSVIAYYIIWVYQIYQMACIYCILLIISMALFVEQKFVNKYRQQYYQRQISVAELQKQQKQLLKLLDDIYQKVNKSFQKACLNAERKGQSQRNSFLKQNSCRLPHIVTDAEIKNSYTYRNLLQNEKNQLQKRMKISKQLKEKDLNKQIKSQRDKVMSLIKKNKYEKLEIKKLGEKLIDQKKSPKQIHEQLFQQLKMKKSQNQLKRLRITQNQSKIQELRQKTIEIDRNIGQIDNTEDRELQQLQENENKIATLEKARQKVRQNVQSFKTRLSQEYYCKLKQLETIIKKGEYLDSQLEDLQLKIEQRSEQMTKSIVLLD